MSSNELRSQKRAKVMAVLAAGSVVGVAATLTLASWNESEWVRGVLGGDNANIGTDIFEVQQNTTSPFDNATANWADREENDEDAGELQFTTGSLSLTPGDSIYAPVALRTVENSLAGTVDLRAAVPAAGVVVSDADDALWDALDLRVIVSDSTVTCGAAAFDGAATYLVGTESTYGTLNTAGTRPAGDLGELDGNAAETQHYCFEITLPTSEASNNDLQGRTVAPAWEFAFESIMP